MNKTSKPKNGVVYTPDRLINDIFARIVITPTTRFLEPCAGDGAILVRLIHHLCLSWSNPLHVYAWFRDYVTACDRYVFALQSAYTRCCQAFVHHGVSDVHLEHCFRHQDSLTLMVTLTCVSATHLIFVCIISLKASALSYAKRLRHVALARLILSLRLLSI